MMNLGNIKGFQQRLSEQGEEVPWIYTGWLYTGPFETLTNRMDELKEKIDEAIESELEPE